MTPGVCGVTCPLPPGVGRGTPAVALGPRRQIARRRLGGLGEGPQELRWAGPGGGDTTRSGVPKTQRPRRKGRSRDPPNASQLRRPEPEVWGDLGRQPACGGGGGRQRRGQQQGLGRKGFVYCFRN